MTDKEICRYLELVDRRLFILVHSGINWKPEYAEELEAIDRELEVSESKAYGIIRQMNDELKAKGFITIPGKVSTVFFEEKIYGVHAK